MLTRIITALLGIPLLVYVLYKGGVFITFVLTAVALVALWEFYNAFKKVDILAFNVAGLLSSAVMTCAAGIYPEGAAGNLAAVLVACTMVCFVQMILRKKARLNDLGITLLGLIYISVPMSMMLMLYHLDNGRVFIWLVFVLAWFGDTLAYFIGITMGKHKLCPAISPKKSIEGSAAGFAGSISGSVMFGYAAWRLFGIDYKVVNMLLVGFAGGILAQLGDLTASLIKRHAGVKDYGSIMPGHGGVLDRFDSVLFVIPMVYYYIRYFTG
jgi:phosphatidate cytidylyltransferase